MEQLIMNKPLVSAFIAFILAQILKIFFNLIMDREFNLRAAVSTGGMPSSHTATVSGLTTSIALMYSPGSTLFAVALVFSIIVIYDAVGIRQAAGKHAEILNELTTILSEISEYGLQPKNLKTLLGHTYPQVAAGTLLGVFVGYAITNFS